MIPIINKRSKTNKQKKSPKNILSRQGNEKLSRKALRQWYKDKDRKAKEEARNSPNYNSYSPLAVEDYEMSENDPNRASIPKKSEVDLYLQMMAELDDINHEENNHITTGYNLDDDKKPAAKNNKKSKTPNVSTINQETIPTIINDDSINPEVVGDVSDIYAPRNVSFDYENRLNLEEFKKHINHRFSLVVRVNLKDSKLVIHEGRLLLALLRSFQKIMPFTSIIPFKKNSEENNIALEENIQYNDEFYKHFFELPKLNIRNKTFVTRLHFQSKKPFYWIKKNTFFQQWLQTEKIRLEENNIEDLHCPKVGFLTQSHPRMSLTKIYEERVKDLFQDETIPPFYCCVEEIGSGQSHCKVIVVKAAEKHVMKFVNLFQKYALKNTYKFIAWKQWTAMEPSKQIDLIQIQNNRLARSKSILLSGFVDDDIITMNHSFTTKMNDSLDWESENTINKEDKDDEDLQVIDIYGDMTVRQFLLSKYKTGTGEPLFSFCFPVKYGMREFVVKNKHAQEAIDFCKVAKEDMLAYMSNDAPGMIFENLDSVLEKAQDHIPWESYTMANDYESVIPEIEEQVKPNRKRNKSDNYNTNNKNNYSISRKSYSDATKNSSNSNKNTIESHGKAAITLGQSENKKKMASEILALKQQIALLCKKQEEQDAFIIESNKKLSNDMITINNETKDIVLKEIHLTNTNVNNLQHTVDSLPTKNWMEAAFASLRQPNKQTTNEMEEDNELYIRKNELNKRKKDFSADDTEQDRKSVV